MIYLILMVIREKKMKLNLHTTMMKRMKNLSKTRKITKLLQKLNNLQASILKKFKYQIE